jgi:hypothetical protein
MPVAVMTLAKVSKRVVRWTSVPLTVKDFPKELKSILPTAWAIAGDVKAKMMTRISLMRVLDGGLDEALQKTCQGS